VHQLKSILKMSDNMEIDTAPPGGAGGMEYEQTMNGDRSREGRPPERSFNRRRSMSEEEERSRRASIKAIMADTSITPAERRKSIQNLMDGRRSSIGTNSVASSVSSVGGDIDTPDYGYGDDNGPTSGQVDASVYGYGDDQPSFQPAQENFEPHSNENTRRAEQTRPPCEHYDRNCTMIAPCCGAAFGCRICHDDSPILPPLLMMKQARRYPRSSSMPGSFTSMAQTPEDTHHPIDRFAVKEVICRECFTRQSSKT
jgi:hypothetical protein